MGKGKYISIPTYYIYYLALYISTPSICCRHHVRAIVMVSCMLTVVNCNLVFIAH